MNAAEQLIEQGWKEGWKEGRQEGLREVIVAALSARSISLSDLGRARLASCIDLALLNRWLTRAVAATSEAEVFGTEGS